MHRSVSQSTNKVYTELNILKFVFVAICNIMYRRASFHYKEHLYLQVIGILNIKVGSYIIMVGLIFIMGVAIVVRRHIYIETAHGRIIRI